MPETANIVVADATPADHTLYPRQAGLGLSTWSSKEAATYDGELRLSVTMSLPSKNRATTRMRQTFTVPVEREVDGVVQVDDTITYITDVVIPKTCSDAEAAKAAALFRNLQDNSLIQSYFASREPVR